jgi:uncharacterized protein
LKKIGVISDTHGLLRPQALVALQGSELIIHAGDIGSPEVIYALQQVAPVFAVCGNVDRGLWAARFPSTQVVEVDKTFLYVLHDRAQLDLDPVAAGFQVVIYGHSHEPSITMEGGVLYLNPGSAGPRRFRLPISLARLNIDTASPTAEIIELKV